LWSVFQGNSSNIETYCASCEGHKVNSLVHLHLYLKFKIILCKCEKSYKFFKVDLMSLRVVVIEIG
jgi:hypothetical protein